MDLNLDVKLHNAISKNELVTVFSAQQNDSMFILTSNLNGYERRDIKIEINEDGSRITVSGENPNSNSKGFHKTFTIPGGVVLDKVKARFDQDESRLTIRMPKSVKGLTRIGIQELKDELHPGKGAASSLQNHNAHQEMQESGGLNQEDDAQDVTQDQECQVNKIQAENHEKVDKMEEDTNNQEAKPPEKTSITYTPIIVGSALLASFIVVVFNLMRSKNESTKRPN